MRPINTNLTYAIGRLAPLFNETGAVMRTPAQIAKVISIIGYANNPLQRDVEQALHQLGYQYEIRERSMGALLYFNLSKNSSQEIRNK